MNRTLQLEPLESRNLAAVASFEVNLLEDLNGTAGAPLSGDTVAVGQTFFVEITARENHPLFSGLGGISLDIKWNPDVLKEVDTSFDPSDPNNPIITSNFPIFRWGTLDNNAGTIDDLGGSSFIATGTGRAIGNRGPERFSLLRFQAVQSADNAHFTIRQGPSRIATVPVSSLNRSNLYFESQTIRVGFVGPLEADVFFHSLAGECHD